MNAPRPCALGCRNRDRIPYRAAPGSNVCPRCSDRLRTTLDHIESTYYTVTATAELIPSNHGPGTGVRTPPGPRSPTNDTILVHTDPRSTLDDQPAALATIESWARMLRETRGYLVPAGRITMNRELRTLRHDWDWLMAQGTVADFAQEMHAVLHALRTVDTQQAKATRVGKCQIVVAAFALPDGSTVDLECGAWLRLKPGDTEIRCRNCGHTWPKARWNEIGEPWTTYAELARVWAMPASTLRWWAKEDSWRTVRLGRDAVVLRADAVATYVARRGIPVGEAG